MSTRSASVPYLSRINDVIERILLGFALTLMISFVAVVTTEVFLRYVLNSSQAWTQETARLTFMWSIFTAAAVAFRHSDHLAVDVVRFRTGTTSARVHEWALHVIALVILAAYTYLGILVTEVGLARSFLIVPLPIAAGWAAIPFMGGFATLFVVERGLIGLRSRGETFDPDRKIRPVFEAIAEEDTP